MSEPSALSPIQDYKSSKLSNLGAEREQMVLMSVPGCQMRGYSQEMVKQENLKRFLGQRQATLETGKMMGQ